MMFLTKSITIRLFYSFKELVSISYCDNNLNVCMYVMILFSVHIYNPDICDSHSWPGKINNFYLSGNP